MRVTLSSGRVHVCCLLGFGFGVQGLGYLPRAFLNRNLPESSEGHSQPLFPALEGVLNSAGSRYVRS